ncbi:alpha/beta fold hydrolase [Auritidibacter ignavus]|uniref:alpha/beta fold hydrolase n=1 Tax=Auritidibacter ignavus TaxID=678932 RepID=UPI003133A67A
MRDPLNLPYRRQADRGGVGGFVADIPTDATHRSAPALRRVATALSETSLPALIIWGATDPVFQDRYLNDLRQRLPQADVHRVETGGHLIVEDVDYAAIVLEWVSQQLSADDNSPTVNTTATITHSGHSANQPRPAGSAHEVPYQPLWEFLYRGEDSAAAALVDMSVSDRGKPFTVSWAQLSQLVAAIAQGLWDLGLRPGDRVCILVPPGRDLTAGLYALLRIGGVAVIADQGLGITGMTRAVRSANPDWIIGETPGLILARAQGWPGRRISVSTLSTPLAGVLGVEDSLYGMALREKTTTRLSALQAPTPDPESLAAILFTSGSTGPAKGVRYTHTGLSHLTQLLRDTFGVTPGASLLAGFAPFALLGPAIGATSVTPRMSVTKPATLTASALADAAIAGQSTIAFGSPAALRNVAATARELSRAQREALAGITMMLSAGAPVSQDLVRDIQVLMPQAEIHSPYGMTEPLATPVYWWAPRPVKSALPWPRWMTMVSRPKHCITPRIRWTSWAKSWCRPPICAKAMTHCGTSPLKPPTISSTGYAGTAPAISGTWMRPADSGSKVAPTTSSPPRLDPWVRCTSKNTSPHYQRYTGLQLSDTDRPAPKLWWSLSNPSVRSLAQSSLDWLPPN